MMGASHHFSWRVLNRGRSYLIPLSENFYLTTDDKLNAYGEN